VIELHDVAAVVVVGGGVAALSSRDARGVAAGVVVAIATSPLVASPAPSTLTICVRVVGALLAGYMLWTFARNRSAGEAGSALGLPAEAALAAAAFCVGWLATPVAAVDGSHAAQAAGISLAAVAVAPLAGRDPLRTGTALVGVVLAASLLLGAWLGPASPLAQVTWTGLLLGVAGATSLLHTQAMSEAQPPMAVHVAATATAETEPVPPAETEPPAETDTTGRRIANPRSGRLRPRSDS
jgi:hypothetical protein